MTAQQQQKRISKWININTLITGICTAVLIWVGSGMRKMYNAQLMQPKIDEVQTAAIINIISDVKELKAATEQIRNEQTRMGGKLIYLEAILPDKNQFKIKR